MSTITCGRAGLMLAATAVVAAALLPLAAAEPTTSPEYPTDQYGYVNTGARCDDDQTLVEYGRTARALVAICVAADGELEYRAVRLSDQAELTVPASRASDGAVIATNDSVTYTVSKESLLVTDGDDVVYQDQWTDFQQPRFPSPTTSSAPAPSTPASPTTAPPTVTVSTTTVTPTPSPHS